MSGAHVGQCLAPDLILYIYTVILPGRIKISCLMRNTEQLLKHPDIWRAGELQRRTPQPTINTGHTGLNRHLPGHGWPSAGLMELLLATAGSGELRLLMPALVHLAQTQTRWIAWINPPFIPYAPALQAANLALHRLLIIRPRTHQDVLWALERAARSGSCSCVLAWPDPYKLKAQDTRRLQLACQQGNTLTCLFRPHSMAQQASMAELRLLLKATAPGELSVDILKRRGGWPIQGIRLSTSAYDHHARTNDAAVMEKLQLWRALGKPLHSDEFQPAVQIPYREDIEETPVAYRPVSTSHRQVH